MNRICLQTKIFWAFLLFACVTIEAQARDIAAIKNSGELRVGVRDRSLPPMVIIKGKQRTGVDPDIAKALAKSLGVRVRWIPYNRLTDREAFLKSDKADMVISLYSITEKRMKEVNFSDAYYTSGSFIMIRSEDKNTIKSATDLKGKRVETKKGSIHAALIDKFLPDIASSSLSHNINVSFESLKQKKVDAVVYDKPILDYFVSQNKGFYVLDNASLGPDEYGMGVSKQNRELLAYINDFLAQSKSNGVLNTIFQRYAIKKPKPLNTSVALSGKSDNYTIKSGDTLSKIAFKFYQDPSKWSLIFDANRKKIQSANVIYSGRKIKIPRLQQISQPASAVTAGSSGNSSTKREACQKLEDLKKMKGKISDASYVTLEMKFVEQCLQ